MWVMRWGLGGEVGGDEGGSCSGWELAWAQVDSDPFL